MTVWDVISRRSRVQEIGGPPAYVDLLHHELFEMTRAYYHDRLQQCATLPMYRLLFRIENTGGGLLG